MIKVETFINELDGKTLKRLYSDLGVYIKEIATGAEYEEAIIPYARTKDEFIETDKPIVEETTED